MIREYLAESQALAGVLAKDAMLPQRFEKTVDAVVAAFKTGHKVLAAGNGGSAADAQHFSAEFVGKYKMVRDAYPAIALTTDASVLTAWANDVAFEGIFERQIEGLGREGDVFFGISTSGNSKNVIAALAKAKSMGLTTVAMLGGDGGEIRGMADIEFIIPSKNTPRIQEMHKLFLHSIAEEAEKRMS
jgi:D-sedoheptulose 7-phosphate isomerase